MRWLLLSVVAVTVGCGGLEAPVDDVGYRTPCGMTGDIDGIDALEADLVGAFGETWSRETACAALNGVTLIVEERSGGLFETAGGRRIRVPPGDLRRDGVLSHEVTHAFDYYASGGRGPTDTHWLTADDVEVVEAINAFHFAQ